MVSIGVAYSGIPPSSFLRYSSHIFRFSRMFHSGLPACFFVEAVSIQQPVNTHNSGQAEYFCRAVRR